MIKTLFIGTSEYAVPILEKLVSMQNINVVGIVTQPDKRVGRHQELQSPPIKVKAKNLLPIPMHNIPIFQPKKIKNDTHQILDKTKPDLILVVAYGQIIPTIMLNYPKFKTLNVHFSLLPKLRGAVPVQIAILQGMKKTGITIQIMQEKLDAGDIIAQEEVKIKENDTAKSLSETLSKLGAKLVERILPKWVNNEIITIKQDENQATYCFQRDIAKEKAEIDWRKSVQDIDRIIRAFYPWPLAWTITKSTAGKPDIGIEANTKFAGKRLLIHKAKIFDKNWQNKKGGKLFKYGNQLLARCDIGWLEILECQLEGKLRMKAKDYLFLAKSEINSARAIITH